MVQAIPLRGRVLNWVELWAQAMSDPIVESVREKLLQRSKAGLLKYGVGLDRTDLTRRDWFVHLQEELLDAANYVEVLIQDEEAKRPIIPTTSNAIWDGDKTVYIRETEGWRKHSIVPFVSRKPADGLEP